MEHFPYKFTSPREKETITISESNYDSFVDIIRSGNCLKHIKNGGRCRAEMVVDVYYALIELNLLFRKDFLSKIKTSIPELYMNLREAQDKEGMLLRDFHYPLSPDLKESIIKMSDAEFVNWLYKELRDDMLTHQYGSTEFKLKAINKVRSLSNEEIDRITMHKEEPRKVEAPKSLKNQRLLRSRNLALLGLRSRKCLYR